MFRNDLVWSYTSSAIMLSCWFSSFQWIQDFVYKTFFNWWYLKVFASTLWRTSCKQATTPHLWSSSFCRVPEILCSKCLLLANFVFDKNVLKHVILIWSHESPDCNTIFFFQNKFFTLCLSKPKTNRIKLRNVLYIDIFINWVDN